MERFQNIGTNYEYSNAISGVCFYLNKVFLMGVGAGYRSVAGRGKWKAVRCANQSLYARDELPTESRKARTYPHAMGSSPVAAP